VSASLESAAAEARDWRLQYHERFAGLRRSGRPIGASTTRPATLAATSDSIGDHAAEQRRELGNAAHYFASSTRSQAAPSEFSPAPALVAPLAAETRKSRSPAQRTQRI
jgi:hypothetical protein